MLLDIYGQKGMDEFNDNLSVLDKLLESKSFLTGISPSFDMTDIDVEALSSFTVINKCSWAIEMLDLDGMQEKQCPYTYQYYAGMHNFSFLKTGNKKEFSEQKEIMDRINSCRKSEDDYFYVQRKVGNRFGALGISNFLAENYCDPRLSAEEVKYNISERLYMQVQDDFDLMVHACYFGALEADPCSQRLFQAYQTGGMPCGWLGLVDYQDGADPKDCIALFHMHA